MVGFVAGGRPLYLAAYGLLAAVVAARWLPARVPGLEAERASAPARLTAGDEVETVVRLRATRRVTAVVVEDDTSPGLGGRRRIPVDVLGAGEAREVSQPIVARHRGAHRLGPLVAVTTDRLGLTVRRVPLAEPDEVLVHPLRWASFEDPPRARLFDEPPRRPPITRTWPSGYDLAGLRDWAPGDDLRRVVWRASARTGRIVVREAERGITDLTTVLVDTDAARHAAPGPDGLSPTFEAAVSAAASLVEATLVDGLAVALRDLAGTRAGPMRGRAELVPALDACTRLDFTEGSLVQALATLRAGGARAMHLVVITPALDAPARATLAQLLDRDTSVTVVDVSGAGRPITPPSGVALLRVGATGPIATSDDATGRAAAVAAR